MGSPAVEALHLAEFGEALRAEREREGYSQASFVKHMGGVSKDCLREWESGHECPPKAARQQIYAVLPRLKRYESDLQLRNFIAAERPAPSPVAAPEPPPAYAPPVGTFATFGAALEAARTVAGLKPDELAKLCDVSGGAVYFWEDNTNAPIADHYEKLLDLFPELRNAPKPKVRDIEKPGREPGYQTTTVRTVHFDPRVAEDASRPEPVAPVPERQPEPEPEPMPEPTAAPAPVSLPAIVRWTTATQKLQLDKAQADALGELLQAGAGLGLGVEAIGQVLAQWPARQGSVTGHR